MILQHVGDDMDHLAFALQPAFDVDHRRGQYDMALRFEFPLPDDRIRDPGFILDRYERDIGRARPLAHQDDTGDLHLAAVLDPPEIGTGDNAPPFQLGPQE